MNKIFSLCAICAIFTSAIAQENSNENLDEIEVTEYIGSDDGYRAVSSEIGKTKRPILEIPQTLNVVTNQQLKDKKPQSLAEALHYVSGISYGNTTGNIFDSIIKRGFGGGRDGSFMRNGMPAAVMHNYNKTIQSVEVLKGPASLLYGAQEPGGVINMVTKKPQFEQSNEIWLGAGNRNYFNAGFDSTGAISENFAYRGIFDYSKKDYWREFGKYENFTIAPSLTYAKDDLRIDLGYTHTYSLSPIDRGRYLDPATKKFVPVDKKVRLDEPINELKAKVDTLDFALEQNFGDNWVLNAKYAYTRSKHAYGHVRVQRYYDSATKKFKAGDVTRRNEYYYDFEHKTHAGSVTLNGKFETGALSHDLLFGVDYKHHYRYRPAALQDSGSAWPYVININDIKYGGLSRATTEQTTLQKQRLKTLGIFAQDSVNLTPDLILSAGLRYEYFDQIAGQGYGRAYSTDQQDDKLTYQAGLLYKITPHWSVYTNYAQSFNPQVSFNTPVGELEPEEGESIELGTKFQNDRITATAAIFEIKKENVMRSYTNSLGNSVTELVGEQKSKGFEFDISGRVTNGLSLGASYTYTKATYEKDEGTYKPLVGMQIEATPKHQAALFANYDFTHLGIKGLRIGGGARYFGSWNTYQINGTSDTDTFKLPHATIYDAFISYDTKIAGLETNFSFNAKNLTDKTYYTSTSTNTSANVIPVQFGDARTFMFSVDVKF